MKRIALLSLPDPRYTNPSDPAYEPNRVDYRVLIDQAVKLPLDRQNGATIDEMRKGIRILDALDGCPKTFGLQPEILTLEDADWEFLKSKVERMPWALVDRRFVQFYDDVVGATDAVRDGTRADGVAAS
jgi:hypothetical protein